MKSDLLSQSQKTDRKYAQIAAKSHQSVHRLYESTFFDSAQRAKRLNDEVAMLKQQFDIVDAQLSANRAAIEERLSRRRIQPTPEARSMVKERLSEQGGWTFTDLLQHLQKQGDRVGIGALYEHLDDLARRGKLPGDTTHTTYDEQVEHAKGTIAELEKKLWSDQERQDRYELEEINLNTPLMAQNRKIVEQFFTEALANPQNVKRPIGGDRGFYRWQGLSPNHPGHDPNIKQGFVAVDQLLQEVNEE